MKIRYLNSHNNETGRNNYIKFTNDGQQLKRRLTREGNQSIKEIPQLVTRLNKSPSSQNFYGARLNDNLTNIIPIHQVNIQEEAQHAKSNEKAMQSKQTFTPKGSSGQVFLAFQRQKQSRDKYYKQNTVIEDKLNLTSLQDEENYNETILRIQKPTHAESIKIANNPLTTAIQEAKHSIDEDLEVELQKQRTKLESYIQKRKDEISKQQQKTRERPGQVFFQQSKKN